MEKRNWETNKELKENSEIARGIEGGDGTLKKEDHEMKTRAGLREMNN